jgi:hypothetical protein
MQHQVIRRVPDVFPFLCVAVAGPHEGLAPRVAVVAVGAAAGPHPHRPTGLPVHPPHGGESSVRLTVMVPVSRSRLLICLRAFTRDLMGSVVPW